jgi:hypothetical protein
MKRPFLSLLCAITLVLGVVITPPLNQPPFTRIALASTLTVTNTNDSGMGSLRQAILDSNVGDTINFNLALPATITLTSGEILINKGVTIGGPGANLLTISGGGASRVFTVGGSTIISGLTITGGHATDAFGGGGVLANGSFTMTGCMISGNTATPTGMGFLPGGGGIYIDAFGTFNVTNCVISGNSTSGSGGAINISTPTGTLNITSSTISANTANYAGGGILIAAGTVNVMNSTISSNLASGPSAG